MIARAIIPASLSVFGPDGRIGTLYPGPPLRFEYCPSWLALPGAMPLHPRIPLGAGRIDSAFVTAFFENLLPEGDQRRHLTTREQVSTVYGLLWKIGGESAGSIVLLPEGEQPQPPSYQCLTWDQVDALAHAGMHPAELDAIERAAQGMPRPRMSLSGAQHKLALYIGDDGMPCRPMGNSPSTHILKPDIVRNDINIFASAANETIMMLLADACGLPTAQVAYQSQTRACLVTRYDRERRPDGSVRRLWQADFCQLLGVQSDVKYEHDGGPGFKQCFDLLKQSTQPAIDQRNLLRWLFFNLCTGNNDSHAKNLSMIASGRGMRLAPFYDLMCTRVYPGLGSGFAFAIAGETNPGQLTPTQFNELARSLDIAPKYLLKLGRDMAASIDAGIEGAAARVLPFLATGQDILVERIMAKTRSMTRKLAARLDGHDHTPRDDVA